MEKEPVDFWVMEAIGIDIAQCLDEFRGKVGDGPTRSEYWLEHTQRVLDEILCPPYDCLRFVVSLMKVEAFYWWTALIAVVPKARVNWVFFKTEFRKKYVKKRYLNKRKKEFLKLKQGNQSVAKYECKFVQLSKYACEIVSSEEEMGIRLEDGLNDEIKLLVGVMKI
ncbi:uncharacterized protein LOC105787013 [Gossypium raimondii]|uniref:uncharacterized protein LOC105787013 n=1 Tax=Gossypium raimondii TaxID=29730 RepID=UPI00063AD550|nr:uncharacterized protein LOC105787013 [Gossypium raimondii]